METVWATWFLHWMLDQERGPLVPTSEEQTQRQDQQGQGEEHVTRPVSKLLLVMFILTLLYIQKVRGQRSPTCWRWGLEFVWGFTSDCCRRAETVVLFSSFLPVPYLSCRTVRTWSPDAGLGHPWITASSSPWRWRVVTLGASKSSRFTTSPGQNLMIWCMSQVRPSPSFFPVLSQRALPLLSDGSWRLEKHHPTQPVFQQQLPQNVQPAVRRWEEEVLLLAPDSGRTSAAERGDPHVDRRVAAAAGAEHGAPRWSMEKPQTHETRFITDECLPLVSDLIHSLLALWLTLKSLSFQNKMYMQNVFFPSVVK